MPFTVTMPKLSPTMEEGTIVKWHVKEGESIEAGAVLIEVATDKATVEHNAIDEGVLRKILIPEGETAIVNQPIAIFTETADESIEGYQPEGIAPEAPPHLKKRKLKKHLLAKRPPKAAAPPPTTGGAMAQPAFVPEEPLETMGFEEAGSEFQGRLLASPLARKIAEQEGIDLSTVKGSGPRGRIVSSDLERGEKKALVRFGPSPKPSILPGTYEEEAPTQMRKAIARRLQESKTFIPHFYVTQEIDAEPMAAIRAHLKEGGLRVTFNDMILKASALALKEHPVINSGYNTVNGTIIRFKTVDISVAVTLPTGLITPIIRHADYKDLGTISSEVRSLAKRARDGKLAREEYMGGSFSLSNMGMYGVRDFVAVINPPQAAILAIAGIQEKPVVRNGEIRVGKTLSVTLSSDHRVIDGTDAAEFLVTLKKILENPSLLLV